jgi:nucleotide-binding universal stress UspA family protein
MYQRILVAVDDSEVSRSAMAEAVRLARSLEARVCFAHCIDAVTTNAYKGADLGEFLAPRVEAGRALLAQASELARQGGVRWEVRLIEVHVIGRNRLAEAVAEEAASWGAELILVGTRGRRGVGHLLLGSVAEGLVRTSLKPVIVVPPTAGATTGSERSYGSLLVAVDGTHPANRALRESIRLAQALKSVVRAVVVADDRGQQGFAQRAEEVLGAARVQASEAGVVLQTAALQAGGSPSGAVADALLEDAAAWPADLILLGTHARDGLDRLLLGSVAEAVLPKAPAPVLVVRSDTAYTSS